MGIILTKLLRADEIKIMTEDHREKSNVLHVIIK
jgi:hypothetical protein